MILQSRQYRGVLVVLVSIAAWLVDHPQGRSGRCTVCKSKKCGQPIHPTYPIGNPVCGSARGLITKLMSGLYAILVPDHLNHARFDHQYHARGCTNTRKSAVVYKVEDSSRRSAPKTQVSSSALTTEHLHCTQDEDLTLTPRPRHHRLCPSFGRR